METLAMPGTIRLLVAVVVAAAVLVALPGVAEAKKCPAGDRCQCQRHHQVLCIDSRQLPPNLPSHTTLLHLTSFNFTSLPGRGFAGLPHSGSLQKLWLSEGWVEVVQKDSFSGLPALRELVLEHNVIRSMHPEAFGGLVNLSALTIRDSYFQTIPSQLFGGLQGATRLAFESNYLASVPSNAFQHMVSLQRLSLNGNRLLALKNYVSWNGLSGSLTELTIEGNQLASIGNEVFSLLTSLKRLSLADNELRGISRMAFSGLNSLEVLDLSRNPLGRVPSLAFSGLPQLLEMALQHIGLSQGQGMEADTFADARQLQALDLSNNPYLGQVPTWALARLTSLQSLQLDNTGLFNLTAYAFANITSLRSISLYRSQVQWMDERALAGLVHLERINLKENLLSSLPKLVFSSLRPTNTTLVELGGNLWTCDCYMKEFSAWMHRTYPRGGKLFSGLDCNSPVQFAGTSLWDVPTSNLTCPPVPPTTHHQRDHARLIAGSVVGLLFAGIVLFVGGYLYYNWRKKARHIRYRVQLSTQSRLWDDAEEIAAAPAPPEITVYCNPRDGDYPSGYRHFGGGGADAASPFSSDNESGEEGDGVNSIFTVTEVLLHDTSTIQGSTNV